MVAQPLLNGEWEGSSFEAAFDRLMPELFDVPNTPNGSPKLAINEPDTYDEHDVHPYAAMYHRAMEQAT